MPMSDHVRRLSDKRDKVKLGVRPWGIEVSRNASPGSVPGTVSVVEDLGDETRVGVRFGDILVMASVPLTKQYKPGSLVQLSFSDEDLNLFDIQTGDRLIG